MQYPGFSGPFGYPPYPSMYGPPSSYPPQPFGPPANYPPSSYPPSAFPPMSQQSSQPPAPQSQQPQPQPQPQSQPQPPAQPSPPPQQQPEPQQPPQPEVATPEEPMNPPPSSGLPYLGARISLISNANIRYEGTLYTIDTKESSVALQNVRCFGTEDRPAEPFVPPSSDLYEYVIFTGRDIKDVVVLERPQPKPLNDPAIVSQGSLPLPPTLSSEQDAKTIEGETNKKEIFTEEETELQSQPLSQPSSEGQPQERSGIKSSGHRGGHRAHEASARQPGFRQRGGRGKTAEFDQEYDFEAANAQFEKLKISEEKSVASDAAAAADVLNSMPQLPKVDESSLPAVTKKYDATKSFFDSLSSEKNNDSRFKERQLNAETFGQSSNGGRGQFDNRRNFGDRNYDNRNRNYENRNYQGRPHNERNGDRNYSDNQERNYQERNYQERSNPRGRGRGSYRGRGGFQNQQQQQQQQASKSNWRNQE